MFVYKTHGTCSKQIQLEIQDGIITSCKFIGGCSGNAQGISRMVVGQKAEDVAKLLAGIPCQGNTSCPDQLAKAIEAYLQKDAG
jgi:uncharacterized protein (TIGR03905 family)